MSEETPTPPADNVVDIRNAIEGAQPADPPDGREDGGKKKRGGPPRFGLPDDAPITPLGKNLDQYFYLDATRQLRVLRVKDHSRAMMVSLCGDRYDWVYDVYPRYDNGGRQNGINTTKLMDDLMLQAARAGIWDPFEKCREAGAWQGPNGGLVLHCGDAVWLEDKWVEPGEYGGIVYPANPPAPRPIEADPGTKPAEKLLEILSTWNFERGELDARLALGWIGCAMIGGALDWRPIMWIVGDKNTGKSTLQRNLKSVIGSLISVTDSTAAGIWQKVGRKSIPIALDEFESESDNRSKQRVIKLARDAASGGIMLRGGADHTGTDFRTRSCFLFSSILTPPLLPQDRSRMAILELGPLPEGAKPPAVSDQDMAELGAQLLGRLAANFERFAELYLVYRDLLGGVGHDNRGQDQFGSLLAAADLLLADAAPGEALSDEAWAAELSPQALGAVEDDETDQWTCVRHLLTSPLDVWRSGSRETVAHYVKQAIEPDDGSNSELETRKRLEGHGIKVTVRAGRFYVAVANSHQGLTGVFRDTHWAGRSGTSGVWPQSLKRLPEAVSKRHRFEGVRIACVEVPFDIIMPKEEAA